MSAAGAFAGIRLTGCGIEMVAPDAQEGGFAAGVLEKRVVAAVVKHPQSQKKSRDEQAVDDRGGGEIHAAIKDSLVIGTNDMLTSVECAH
jgi:hypothetical protein